MQYRLVVKSYKNSKEVTHYAFPNKSIVMCWKDLNENYIRMISDPLLQERVDHVHIMIEFKKSVIYSCHIEWIKEGENEGLFEYKDVFSNEFNVHLLQEIKEHSQIVVDIIASLEDNNFDDSIDDNMMRSDLDLN